MVLAVATHEQWPFNSAENMWISKRLEFDPEKFFAWLLLLFKLLENDFRQTFFELITDTTNHSCFPHPFVFVTSGLASVK